MFEKNQRVLVVERRADGERRPHNGIVTRVGSTYAYVEVEGQYRPITRVFYLANGHEKDRPATGATIYTPEAYAERQQRSTLTSELRDLGVDFRLGCGLPERLTIEQMERLRDLLREGRR